VGRVEDRWYKVVKEPDGATRRVKTNGTAPMRYRVRYIAPDGRERSESFPDRAKRDAEAFLATVEVDKLRGSYIDPAAGQKPFAPFAEAWLRTHRLDESTRQSVEVRVRKHIIPYFGDRPIAAIQPSTVRDWEASLVGKLSVGSRSVAFSHLSSILTAAVDDKLIPQKPVLGQVGEQVPARAAQGRSLADRDGQRDPYRPPSPVPDDGRHRGGLRSSAG
jgi:hypothetical protein